MAPLPPRRSPFWLWFYRAAFVAGFLLWLATVLTDDSQLSTAWLGVSLACLALSRIEEKELRQ